jgi:hypothetical protein
MNSGKFPKDHPCEGNSNESTLTSEIGTSDAIKAFRARGYWASCFPEGDGITLKWWDDPSPGQTEKTAEQVMQDIRECFGWEVFQQPGIGKAGKELA